MTRATGPWSAMRASASIVISPAKKNCGNGSDVGADILGGPLKSLRWLANHLILRGAQLRAGQIVIPGSAVELVAVEPGDRLEARFTHVGCVEAAFRAA